MIPYEQDYVAQREDAKSSPGFSEKDFASQVDASEDTGLRALIFFERAVTMAFCGDNIKQTVLREMIEAFMKWVAEQIYIFEQNKALRAERGTARKEKMCPLCEGYYFRK